MSDAPPPDLAGRHIRRSIFEVFGINDDFSQFDGIKDADVQKMVRNIAQQQKLELFSASL